MDLGPYHWGTPVQHIHGDGGGIPPSTDRGAWRGWGRACRRVGSQLVRLVGEELGGIEQFNRQRLGEEPGPTYGFEQRCI